MIPLWLFYLLGFGIAWCSFIAGFILCAMFRVGASSDTEKQPSKTTDDYIDWSKIPSGYDWVAYDGDSAGVNAYINKPEVYRYKILGWRDYSYNAGMGYIQVSEDAIIGPLPPWRESLRRRPR